MNTVSAKIDLDAYLSLLKVDGTLVNVGIDKIMRIAACPKLLFLLVSKTLPTTR